MCQPASFIITQNRVLWHPKSDSHSEILKKYGIRDDYDKPDFVKVEIVPPNNNYKLPIEKWEYSVDSDQYYFPEWYNSVEAEKACRMELKHWYAEKVVKKGKHTLSGEVNKIILGGNITINDLEKGSKIFVYGKSKVEINNMKGGSVKFYNNSTGEVNNQSGGHVEFYDNSTGTLNNQIDEYVRFYDNSTGKVNGQKGGIVRFTSKSTGEINDHSGGYVVFYGNSTGKVNNHYGGEVWFYDNSKQLNN